MNICATRLVATFAVCAGLSIGSSAFADSPQTAFAVENAVAMTKMMADMHVPSSGDIDQDFVAMMIPHHQGAIDMAVAQLRYGSNPQLRRIAQEIIIEQQQEIAAMQIALGRTLPRSAPAPTQVGALSTQESTSQTSHPHDSH